MTSTDSPLQFDGQGRAKPATNAERKLLAAVKTGVEARVSSDLGYIRQGFPQWNYDYIALWDYEYVVRWDYEYIIHVTFLHPIRATFLRHICLHPDLYEVDPRGINISGALIADALDLSFGEVKHPLGFFGCRFDFPPNFLHAHARSMAFLNCFLPGLIAQGLHVAGSLKLAGCTVHDETLLLGADISGQLNCKGAMFVKEGGYAFNADHLKVGDSVFLADVKATGQTLLLGADISGSLNCTGATFTNTHTDNNGEIPSAFVADRLKVGGNVVLVGLTVTGETSLSSADIKGQLDCTGAIFESKVGKALNAQSLKVAGELFWRGFKSPPVGVVDFSFAQVGVLADDAAAWPKGQTYLDGFVYDRLATLIPHKNRRRWLALMPRVDAEGKPVFWPQPYEQLIKVYRNSGHEHDAHKIAMAKQDAYADHLKHKQDHTGKSTWPHRLWMKFLKITSGYGYETWRAVILLLLFWYFGGWLFLGVYADGLMEPAKERVYTDACYVDKSAGEDCAHWGKIRHTAENGDKRYLPPDYPEFNAVIYSLDVLLPIVDLKLEDHWMPSSRSWLGRVYLWLHILMGWVFSTIAVAGFAGVIKKD